MRGRDSGRRITPGREPEGSGRGRGRPRSSSAPKVDQEEEIEEEINLKKNKPITKRKGSLGNIPEKDELDNKSEKGLKLSKNFMKRIDLGPNEEIEGPKVTENVNIFLDALKEITGNEPFYNEPPENKPKKMKDLKELMALNTRNKKKEISIQQKILNIGSKARARTAEQLSAALARKNMQIAMPETQKQLILNILRAKAYNKLVNISDALRGKKLYVKHFLFTDPKFPLSNPVSFVTNDKLYLLCLLVYSLSKSRPQDDPILDQCFIPHEVSIQSVGIEYKPAKKIYTGYIQDYVDYATNIGDTWLSDECKDIYNKFGDYVEEAEKLEEGDPKTKKMQDYEKECTDNKIRICEFKYNQQTYYFLIKIDEDVDGNYAILCIPGNFDLDVVDYRNDQLYVSKDKKKQYVDSIKTYELKNERTLYISSNIKVVDFMPGIVKLSNLVNVAYILKSEINLNQYSEICWEYDDDKYKINDRQTEDPFFLPDIASFETFDTFLNYVLIQLTTHDYPEQVVERFSGYFKEYMEHRSIYLKISKILGSMQRFLVRFFNSFKVKINFDICTSLYNIGKKILKEFQYVYKLPIYKDYITLLRRYLPATQIMYNAASDEANLPIVFNGCIQLLYQLINFEDSGLVDKFRTCGIAIFRMFLGVGNPRVEINDYVTPSAFMGNMKGEFTDANIVENLERFFNNEVNKTIDANTRAIRIRDFMEDEKENIFEALSKGFASYIDSDDEKYNVHYLGAISAFYDDLINSGKYNEYKDKLKSNILSYYIETGDVPYYKDELMRRALLLYDQPILEEYQKDDDEDYVIWSPKEISDIEHSDLEKLFDEYFKIKKEPDVDREDLIIRRNRKKILVKTDPERESKVKKIVNDLTGKKNKKERKERQKEKEKLLAQKRRRNEKDDQEIKDQVDNLRANLDIINANNEIIKKEVQKINKKQQKKRDKSEQSQKSGESGESIGSRVSKTSRAAKEVALKKLEEMEKKGGKKKKK